MARSSAVVGAPAVTAGRSDQADRERGASVVEYALLLALLALVTIGAVRVAGDSVSSMVSSGATGVAEAGS